MTVLPRISRAAALLTLASSILTAGTQSYSVTIPQSSGAFSQPFTLPNFNPAQGFLTGVTITFSYSTTSSVAVVNTNAAPQSFTNATAAIPLTLGAPAGLSATMNSVAGPLSGTVPGGSVVTFPAPPTSGTLTVNVPNGNFSSFETPPSTGTGAYTFSAGSGTYSGSAIPGVGFSGSASAGGTATVTYTFTPPPVISCPSVSSGEVNTAFNATVGVSGGATPYTFSVASGTLPVGLTLNTSSGAITGTPTAPGTFTIQVMDANGTVSASNCPFTITNAPIISCPSVSSGEVNAAFSAAVGASGGTMPYTFSVASGTLPAGLTLNPSTGTITGTPTAAGTFTIQVTDVKGVVSTGSCPFTIISGPTISCPSVSSGEVSVPFSATVGVSGGTSPYTFSVATGTLPAGLALSPSSGAITGTPTAVGSFTIQVTDAKGVTSASSCPFTIISGPTINCPSVSSGEVNVAFSATVGVTGGTSPYTYSLSAGTLPAGLTLNASSGAITGTPTAAGTFTIQVTDAKGVVSASSCPFTIISGPTISCPSVSSGEVSASFSASVGVSGGTSPYIFSVASGTLPAGLSLNASTGAITGTPTAAGTFTIQVTDAKGVVSASSCPFTIISGPTISCPSVSSGEMNAAFSATVGVTGGTSPYTFSAATGTLPAGLTLNSSSGAITGTPTAAGTFTIQVTDAKGVVATSSCPFTIISGPSISCPSVSSGEVNAAFSATVGVSGGTSPDIFSVASGTLPAGLSLNASTGVITGTPTAAGAFTIQVTDAKGVVSASSCPFTISNGPIISCPLVSSGEVNAAFSATVGVSGGTSPYVFSVASGTLPAGLSLNASTGAITGTPTAAGSFTIQVTDGKGVVSASSCPFTIINGPTINCPSVSSGEAGVAFSSTIGVSGGTAPYLFSVASGALPAGLTLNSSSGAITGTPTAAGTFTIKVTDGKGVVSASSCPFIIVSAPIISCPLVSSGEVNVAFSATVGVSGGTSLYTFSVASGTLPAGLTLNSSSGAITGTPTAAGTFTIQVTDGKGVVSASSCPFTISNGPIISCPLVSSGEVNVAFSATVGVSGGTSPYTFSVASGTLPAGLTLNTSTGAITGTPSAAGTFTIQVTDAKGVVSASNCPFTIINGPTISCPSVSSGEVSVAFSSSVGVNGGMAPYTYSVASGALPAGLTLNPATGAITGTPLSTATFTIQVMDAKGVVSASSCPFTITVPVLTCPSVSSFPAGTTVNSATLTVSGGTAPYTYSVASGTLPAGLTLNSSTGAITGTPTVTGTFTIQVTDARGVTSASSCPFAVTSNGPLPTCPSISSGEINTPFNSPSITVIGGTPPYTFSIIGTLPPGLTLSPSDGSITGTPTATGTFAIQVTDSAGMASTATCLFSINQTVVANAAFLVRYAANLNIGESYVDITNPGTNGAPLLGPGFGGASGNLCVDVFAFDPAEELVSCCSCLVTPNQTVNLGVNRDLTAKTLTGVVPNSVTLKLLATLAGGNGTGTNCAFAAATVTTATLTTGLAAWGTTLHATPTAGNYSTTDAPFTRSTLSPGELASIGGRCASIVGNGSGFGVCNSCRLGAF